MSRSKVFDKRINQSPEVFIRIRDLFTGEAIVVESPLGKQGGANSGAIIQSLNISRQMKSPGRADFTILNRDRKYMYVPSMADTQSKASQQKYPLLNSTPFYSSNGIRYTTPPKDGFTGLTEELWPPVDLPPSELSNDLWAYDREIDFFKTLFLNDSLWTEMNGERAALLQEVYQMKSGSRNPSLLGNHLRRIYETSSIIELRAQVDIDMRDSRGYWFAAFTGFINNIEDTSSAGQVPTLRIGCQDLLAAWAWSMVPTQAAAGPAKAQSTTNKAVQKLITKATGALGIGLNNNLAGLPDSEVVDLLVDVVNSSFTMEGLLDAAGLLPGLGSADLQAAQNAPTVAENEALIKAVKENLALAQKEFDAIPVSKVPAEIQAKAMAQARLDLALRDLKFAENQSKQIAASRATRKSLEAGDSEYSNLQFLRAEQMILGATNDYLAGTDPTVFQQVPFSADLPSLNTRNELAFPNKLTIQTLPDDPFFLGKVVLATEVDPSMNGRFLASVDSWEDTNDKKVVQPLLSVDLEKFWDGPGLYFGTDERIPPLLVRNPKYFRTARPYLRDAFDPAATIAIAQALRTNWNLFFNQVSSAQEIMGNLTQRTFADFYVTGAGWLVYKSPRLNSIPNLQSSPFEDESPKSLLEYMAGPAGQTPPEMFHGSEYVLTGFGQKSRSYNHTMEGRITKVLLPGEVNFLGPLGQISQIVMGTAVAPAELTALLGDRTMSATETMRNLASQELTQMADALLSFTNTAPETAMYVYDRLLPWEIGKNIYDPETDFLYYLTSVSINYQHGQSVSTTLSCRHGHPRKMIIPVPWILWASVAGNSTQPASQQNFGFIRNYMIFAGTDVTSASNPLDGFLKRYTESLYGSSLKDALASFTNPVEPPANIVKASRNNAVVIADRIRNQSVTDASKAKTLVASSDDCKYLNGGALTAPQSSVWYIGEGGRPTEYIIPALVLQASPVPNNPAPSTVNPTPVPGPTPAP